MRLILFGIFRGDVSRTVKAEGEAKGETERLVDASTRRGGRRGEEELVSETGLD